MAKLASIKHYRQTGDVAIPGALPYSEAAVSKDGSLFVGDEANNPIFVGNKTLVHSKTGRVHNLIGTIATTGLISAKFKAVADFVAGDTFTISTLENPLVNAISKT
ncbi:MAG: hypothetical protein WAX04_06630, partial [Oscillospiraceae bacterium]